MKNKIEINGFTLAETLITLGIIGVVAAMTLPTLLKANQNRVNEARYKKAVSMLSQAAQLAMAEVGSPGNMAVTDLWNCKNKENVKACYKTETKKLFKGITLDDDTLINKMKTVNYNEIPNPWGDVYYAFTTGDAMTFGYANSDEGLKLIVDTTSKNKPNKISQDLYALLVKPNGIVVDTDITTTPINSEPVNSEPVNSDPVTSDPVTPDPVTSESGSQCNGISAGEWQACMQSLEDMNPRLKMCHGEYNDGNFGGNASVEYYCPFGYDDAGIVGDIENICANAGATTETEHYSGQTNIYCNYSDGSGDGTDEIIH